MGRGSCGKNGLVTALISKTKDGENTHSSSSPTSQTLDNNSSKERHGSPRSPSSLSSSSSSSSSSEPGVVVHEWTPGNIHASKEETKTEEEQRQSRASIQLWELPGNQVEAHHIYLRPPCLFLITMEVVDDENTSTDLTDMLHILQSKCPGSHVIIAVLESSPSSQQDDNKEVTKKLEQVWDAAQEWLAQRRQNIETEILELQSDIQTVFNRNLMTKTEDEGGKESIPSVKELLYGCTESLQQKLNECLNIHETVYAVNVLSGQGLPELQKILIEKATSLELFPHLACDNSDHIENIAAALLEMKEGGQILLTTKDLQDLIEDKYGDETFPEEKLSEICHQLEASGWILFISHPSFPHKDVTIKHNSCNGGSSLEHCCRSSQRRFVCVNPGAFANIVLSCLTKEEKKTYKLESNRFWPRGSGFKPPDSELLARVLEEVSLEGYIREAILPVLWQDYIYDETQICRVLQCLQWLGVLTSCEKPIQDCAGLAMPHYSNLSPQTCFISVLMDTVPKTRPQLNWTTTPFDDDLQITWKISNVTSTLPGIIRRSLAFTKLVFESCCDYIHIWNEGVLIKFQETTICVEDGKGGVHVSCRVNKNDGETEQKSVQLLWAYMVPVIRTVTDFMSTQIPGCVQHAQISLYGSVFFNDKIPQIESDLSIVKCLMSRQLGSEMVVSEAFAEYQINLNLLFPFQDAPVWTPEDWLNLVTFKARELKKISPEHFHNESKKFSKPKKHLFPKKSIRKNKDVEIKWKIEIEEGEDNKEGSAIQQFNSQTPNGKIPTVLPTGNNQASNISSTSNIQLTHEEWKRRASDLACQFVSCTMALAVADYIAVRSQGIQGVNRKNIEAQITAARVTANAALAVHSGDIDSAAKAVIESVLAVERSWQENSLKSSSKQTSQSRLCSIL